MIESLLRALEASRDTPLCMGLDDMGGLAWQQTGEQLLSRIGAWQGWLRAEGVRPGDRVGIDLSRGPELLPAHAAALAIGSCVVPLNPALTPGERSRVLERAALRTLITGDSTPIKSGSAELTLSSPDTPALLIFTSGTTGEPKGVPHTLSGLEANLEGLAETWALQPGERMLHALPAHHVHGLVLGLYGCARLGMPIVLVPRFQVEACLHALQAFEIQVFMGVPTMYHRLAQAASVPALPAARLFISGSAPLSAHDFSSFEHRFGHRPLERYGLTETLIVSSNPLKGERRAGTVGLALPKTEIQLAADGEILVRGPAVLQGYWQDPAGTAAALRDGFFCTGDLGSFDSAGYLVISGRKKELIIVGGSNVLPGEVEHALAGDPAVDELAVAGLPDPDRGEVVAAFVVLLPGADPSAAERRLRDRAEADLARYKRPVVFHFVPALPRNAMGKVDRRALRSRGAS